MHVDIRLPKDNYSSYEARIGDEAHVAKNTINSVYTNGTISKEDVERLGAFLRSYLNVQSNPEFDIIKENICNLLRNTNFDNVPKGFLPSWIQNDNVKNTNKICPKEFYWTGLLLHMYGFNDLEYLNYGGESVVWADRKNGYVYKVSLLDDDIEIETYKRNNERIHSLHESSNLNGKNIKHLSDAVSVDNNLITRCKLQVDYISNSKDFYEDFYKPQTKNLESLDLFLSYSKGIVKGLIELHKNGYSFNDLKPGNLLLDEKGFKYLKNKYSYLPMDNYKSVSGTLFPESNEQHAVHKYRINLTDYGVLTDLHNEATLDEEGKCPDLFIPKSDVANQSVSNNYTVNQMESAEKRDVYSMGVTLIEMLFKIKYQDNTYDQLINDIKLCASNHDNDSSDTINSLWNNWLKNVYSPKEENRVKKVLILIMEMLIEDPYKRPYYHTVLERLQKIQNMNS